MSPEAGKIKVGSIGLGIRILNSASAASCDLRLSWYESVVDGPSFPSEPMSFNKEHNLISFPLRFIHGHFADSFRLLESAPHPQVDRTEKWISSSTLLEQPESGDSPPAPPKTPEPSTSKRLPRFSLSTPSGSPHSLKSSPSSHGGSPLTALQFIRRADADTPFLRPETPSKPPRRVGTTPMATPSRNSVWRP
jgi:hypothetical protein